MKVVMVLFHLVRNVLLIMLQRCISSSGEPNDIKQLLGGKIKNGGKWERNIIMIGTRMIFAGK